MDLHRMIRRALALAACVLVAGALSAAAAPRRAARPAAAPLIPRAAFFAASTVENAKLSPDGRTFSFHPPRSSDLALLDTATPSRVPRRVHFAAPPAAYEWLYDNSLLALVPDSTGTRVWHVAAGDSVPRDLSFSRCGSVTLLTPSLTHPQIAPLLVAACDSHAAGVFLLDVTSGEVSLEEPLAEFQQVYLDGDFHVRAGTKPNAHGAHVLLALDGAGEWNVIGDYAADEYTEVGGAEGVVSMATDGSELFFVDREGSDTARLRAMRVMRGQWRVVYGNPRCDVLYGGAIVDPRTGRPQAVSYLEGTTRRQFFDPAVQRVVEDIERRAGCDIGVVGRSVDGGVWCVRTFGGGPMRYLLYRTATRTLTPLLSDVPALDGTRLARRTPLIVPARDGLSLACSLFLPPGSDPDGDGVPSRPLPTLLYVHGGPWVGLTLNLWLTNRHLQLLANRGYAVIACEFRGALGFGRAFVDASNGQWKTGMQDDLLDIADAAVRRGIAARGRIGVWGWSYGGYATLGGLAWHGDRYACGIAMYGVSDLEMHCALPNFDNEVWRRRVGSVHSIAGRRLLREASPLRAAATLTKPLLLTHGALDSIVPIAESDSMAAALEEFGRAPLYLVYPDEGHDYAQPANWESFWAIAEAFLREHLGGRAEPAGRALDAPGYEVRSGTAFVDRVRHGGPASGR